MKKYLLLAFTLLFTTIGTVDARNFIYGNGELVLGYELSGETTYATIGDKITFYAPVDMLISKIKLMASGAPVGTTLIVDIKEEGTSILSTLVSIDSDEFHSKDAATPYVISDGAIAEDAKVTISITQVGATAPGNGVKIFLVCTLL